MLTLFHDYTSPLSAVAAVRLQRLADDGCPVEFEGFEAIGVDVALPLTLEVLDALEQVADEAAAEGVVLHRPSALPPTGLAHVVGTFAERAGLGASWRQTCYEAFWEHDADLADPITLTDIATIAGLELAQVQAALSDRRLLTEIRRLMGLHRREGVGGVPTILAHRTLIPGLLPEEDLRALAALG